MQPQPASRTTNRLEAAGITACGILLAMFPLALWVAWSPFVFGVVFAAGLLSAALLLALLAREPDPRAPHRARPSDAERRAVAEEVVHELHGIFPLTYHHSRSGRAPYRRAMARLRRKLR